jgi:hypothetical protein
MARMSDTTQRALSGGLSGGVVGGTVGGVEGLFRVGPGYGYWQGQPDIPYRHVHRRYTG